MNLLVPSEEHVDERMRVELPLQFDERRSRVSLTQELIPVNSLQSIVRFQDDNRPIRSSKFNTRIQSHDIILTKENLLSPLRTPRTPLNRLSRNIPTNSYFKNATSFRDDTLTLKPPRKNDFISIISRYYLVCKFITKLKSIIEKRNPTALTMRQFKFINDKTFNFDVFNFYRELNFTPIYNAKARLSQFINVRRRYTNYSPQKSFEIIEGTFYNLKGIKSRMMKIAEFISILPVIDPSSKYKLLWDSVHCFLILIFFFKIPIELCFSVDLNWKGEDRYKFLSTLIYLLIPTGFFLVDILISFSLGFYRKGKFVNDRKKIVKNYAHNNFLKDFISFLVVIMNLFFLENLDFFGRTICLSFFLKIRTVKTIIGRIEEYMFLDQKSYNNFSLMKLFFRLILISHFFACIWHIIGDLNSNEQSTWINDRGLASSLWYTRYIYSFYFVAITMTTVGYGDIVPKNSLEVLFCIIFVFFACGIFAYSLNSIGLILQDISKRENAFIAQIKVINGYMKKKNIPLFLRHRIRKYLEYLWDEKESQNLQEEEAIINNLSDKLRSELILQANGHSLKKIKVLAMNFSESFLRSAVFIMKEVRFMPGDMIFKEGDLADKNLFLIRDGEVEIFTKTSSNADGQILQVLSKGEVFGEFAFFTDEPRKAFARSTDFTTLIAINREEFIDRIKSFPNDYEKFCSMKDNILLNNDSRQLFINCYACEKPGHSSFSCPSIHKPLLKDICLKKHLYSEEQPRNIVMKERKLYFKIGIMDFQNLKDDAIRFSLNNENIIFNCLNVYDSSQSFSESFDENSDNIFSENSSIDGSKYPITENLNASQTFRSQDIEESETNPLPKLDYVDSPRMRSRSRIAQIRNSDISESNSVTSRRRRNAVASKSRLSLISLKSHGKKLTKSPKLLPEPQVDMNREMDVMRSFSHYNPNGNIKNIIQNLDLTRSKRKRRRPRNSKFRDFSKFVNIFDMKEIQREQYFDDCSVDKFFDMADEASVYQKLRDQVTKVIKKIEMNKVEDKHKFVKKRRKSIFAVHPLIVPKPRIIDQIKGYFSFKKKRNLEL